MHDDAFHHLALKAISGEISSDENAALEHCLKEEPARQAEFEDLRAAFVMAKSTLPLASALEAGPLEPPPHRRQQLRAAVRMHFQKADAADRAKNEFTGLNWLRTWWGRGLCGGGLAAVFAVLILVSWSRPSGIEIGLYAESTTRDGSAAALNLPSTATVRVTRFESDRAFDQWLARPFAKDEKARIWFDEEHDLIHVRLHPTLFHDIREWTYPLPESDVDRRAALDTLLRSL